MIPTLDSFTVRLGVIASFVFVLYQTYRYWIRCKSYAGLPTYNLLFRSYISWLRLLASDGLPPLALIFQAITGVCYMYSTEGIALCWVCFRPMVGIFHADMIKDIISHPSAQDKSHEYDSFKPFFGSGLLTSNGERWHNHRKLITPAFHMGNLRDYVSIFNKHAVILVNKFKELKDKPWISVSKYLSYCSFDIIWESAMGIRMGCQEGHKDAKQFLNNVHKIEQYTINRMYRPWMLVERIFQLTEDGIEMNKAVKENHSITQKIILEKKINLLSDKRDYENETSNVYFCKKNSSFLEILLKCNLSNPEFTLEDVEHEVNTIITGGFDTVYIGMQWCLLLLGLHADVQETAAREIDDIFEKNSNGVITNDDLNDMMYLECVIKESMRLYPPVPLIARYSKEGIKVGKYNIPKGTVVTLILHQLHRDQEFFPDPEKFNPERFYPENSATRHPFAYMPFSAGTRNCIGQKFALMEIKILLAHILRNFSLKALDHRDKIRTSWEISLRNVDDIRIHFMLRQSY